MAYSVHYSDAEITGRAGFSKVAHLPCIFDSRPGYHRLSSSYLIDRGLAVWHPHSRETSLFFAIPSDQTIRNYAYWLANFLEWVESRGIDLATCTLAEHVHGRYRAEMLNGTWSRDNTALSRTTVALRVQQACDFLAWMSDKGHRPAIEATYSVSQVARPSSQLHTKHHSRLPHRNSTTKSIPKRLRMPTDEQLRTWLDKVYERFGHARGLMCETILLTAVRRAEVSSWRIDTLPDDPRTWHVNRHNAPAKEQLVRVTIKFGTKGRDYGKDHGDKVGPERAIWIPLSFARRLHEYRVELRNAGLRKWINSSPSLAIKKTRISESVHLFIDETSGKRLTSKDVYNAWTGVDLPFPGWSPHQGRHWWACSILWTELKKHERLRDLGTETASALLESSAMSIIRLQIQPQLGHAHETTTMIYLRWASETIGVSVSIPYESDFVPIIGQITPDGERLGH